MTDAPRNERALDEEIDRVLGTGELAVHYLPIFSLSEWLAGSRQPTGLEALSRFASGLSPAAVFERAASRALTHPLEVAAIGWALGDLPSVHPALYVSVNVSLATAVSAEVASAASIAPERVVIEIPAPQIIQRSGYAVDSLQSIREMGVRLAIDDAQASLDAMYPLVTVQPEFIKVDNAVIDGIENDAVRRVIVQTMARLGETTGSALLAEGVHTDRLVDLLAELGVRFAQGFGLAEPTPLAESPGSTPLSNP